MIISYVFGGLGNQMFQYSYGLAMARKYGVPLKLDILDFSNISSHNGFELQDVFGLSSPIARRSDFIEIMGWRGVEILRKFQHKSRYKIFRSSKTVQQDLSVGAHENMRKAFDNSYLVGVWQSESYFLQAIDLVREDFHFTGDLGVRNSCLLESIRSKKSVSIHVRRGDYVTNTHANTVHGLCEKDYYQRALSYLAERFDGLNYYVFSDDIAWVKKNIVIPSPITFVEHNTGRKSHIDMRLMSACTHHIIANSTFSWWGAWLSESNSSDSGVIIAPKKWANRKSKALLEVIPQNWERI